MSTATRNIRLRGLLAPALLLAILALVCVPALVVNSHDVSAGGKPDATDGFTSFYTAACDFPRGVLNSFGRLSLWNSCTSSGEPYIVGSQPAFFHPPKPLFSSDTSHASLGSVSFGHLVLGGLGVFLVSQWFGFSQSTSSACGVVVLLGPYFIAQTGTGGVETVFYLVVLLSVLFAADTLHTRNRDNLARPKRRFGKWLLLGVLGASLVAPFSTSDYGVLVDLFATETFVRSGRPSRMPPWETLCLLGVTFALLAAVALRIRGRHRVGPSSPMGRPDFTDCVGVSDYSSMTKVVS